MARGKEKRLLEGREKNNKMQQLDVYD